MQELKFLLLREAGSTTPSARRTQRHRPLSPSALAPRSTATTCRTPLFAWHGPLARLAWAIRTQQRCGESVSVGGVVARSS
eukprot:874181-Prymnesium_polylepis.1